MRESLTLLNNAHKEGPRRARARLIKENSLFKTDPSLPASGSIASLEGLQIDLLHGGAHLFSDSAFQFLK